jgi:SAM-dependent methyltransferase
MNQNGKSGPGFYDDDEVFTTYVRHRRTANSPNETLEKPVILELVRPIAGQRILDLGCGDAEISLTLLDDGAVSYVGVEGSHKMALLAAQTLQGMAGEVIERRIEVWDYPTAAFDLVLARLSLHYIADLAPIFASVAQTLVPGGRLVFSVEHPVITSCDRGWAPGTQRQDWVVDDYFSTGIRVTNWLGGTVQKYHRTIEDYVRLLQSAGFRLDALREAHPRREHFQDESTHARRMRIPLFLIMAAQKVT